MPFGVTIGGQAVDGSNTDLAYGVLKTAVAADAELVVAVRSEQIFINVYEVGDDDWPKDVPVAMIMGPGSKIRMNATQAEKPLPAGDYHMTIVAGDGTAIVRFTIGTPGSPSRWAGGAAPPANTSTEKATVVSTAAAGPSAATSEDDAEPLPQVNDEEALTNMYYAMQNGEIDQFKRWIAAHPRAVTLKDNYLLRGACGFADNPEVVKLILNAGGDPNAKDENNAQNCLHMALEAATEDTAILENVRAIVALLVAKGADVNYKRPQDGFSAIILAAKTSYVGKAIMSELLKGRDADVNARSTGDAAGQTKGWTPLHYVCNRGPAETGENREVADLLIAKGADVSATTLKAVDVMRELWTPLHVAAATNTDRVDVVELLVAKGAVINTLDPKKGTPLEAAMLSNNPKICQFLLEKGADYNIANWEGVTVLRGSYGWGRDKHLESADVIIRWAESHGGR
jgi:ankyrin repeat protein